MTTQEQKRDMSGPEVPGGNFSVEVRYSPDFLFHLLTHDNHWQTISLDNNLGQITEYNYDVFGFVRITLTSDLKVKSQPDWPDRSTKTLSIKAGLWNNEWQHEPFRKDKIPVLIDKLYEQGIDVDLKPFSGDRRFDHSRFLVARDTNPPWALETNAKEFLFNLIQYSTFKEVGVRIILPYPEKLIDLYSSDDIQKAIAPYTKIMEKVMRAFYQMEHKQLPLQNLVFEPREIESTEKANIASCTYCSSDYSIVHGLTCPHCGASKPHFS